MSYTEKTLQKGEKQPVFFEQTPWQYYFSAALGLVIAWFFFALGMGGTSVALLMFIGIPAWLALVWTQRKNTEYAVTNKRVVIKQGIIKRETLDIRSEALESVRISQGIFGRFLNFGDCTITGRGTSDLRMRQVVNPLKVKRTIEEIAS